MEDKYFYDNTKVLKNKLNILDKDKLDAAERDIVALKLFDITVRKPKKFLDYEYLKRLHKHLYGDIYSWAGKERTTMIKTEGISVIGITPSYSYPETITPVLKTTLMNASQVDINRMDLKEKVNHFSTLIADLWRIHPFIKGNTITAISFADQYARYHGISFDYQVLIDNMPYTKKALTRYTDGAYGEPDYLNVIVKDAIRNDIEQKKFINPEAIEKEIIRAGYKPSPFLVDSIEKINLRFSKIHTVRELKELLRSSNLEDRERNIIDSISGEFQNQEQRKMQEAREKQSKKRKTLSQLLQAEL